MEKPVVRLWNSWGLGIIIPYPSGVLYNAQVGGTSCLQLHVEGVYVPLLDELKGNEQEDKLLQFFTGDKWWGACSNGIDEATADFIDVVLAESYNTRFLKVNRGKLKESCEAWIHVTRFPESAPEPFHTILGFQTNEAILTWANSD